MRLEIAGDNDCTAASLAMLFNMASGYIKKELFPPLPQYPFPKPWDDLPMVPSMEMVCDWAWRKQRIALVPFPYHPHCSPHPDCPSIPVWPNDDPDEIFTEQLAYGRGVIEGAVEPELGHIVAWDGKVIYDPRGYIYSLNVADKFNFKPTRFWLAVEVK